MAIYYSQIKNLKRSTGSNSLSSLSYIIGEKVKDETTGRTFNYGRNERVFAYGMELPNGSTFKTPSELFNSLEKYEKQNNARMAKKIICALPREFDEDTQKRVVRDFVKKNFTDKGYPSVWAIHYDDDNNNPHVHIMVANRQLNEKGEWAKYKNKKETVLDHKGRRMPQIDKDKVAQWEEETGKTFNQEDFEYEELCSKFQKLGKRNSKLWQRKNVISNYLDQKATLNDIREDWANQCNVYLEEENKIDHRSNAERGLRTLPQVHLGYKTHQMAQKGVFNDHWKKNALIVDYNKPFLTLSREMKKLKEKINDRIRTFETRFRSLGTKIEELTRRTTERLTRIETRQTRIEELENEIRMDRRRIEEIEEWTISPQVDQDPIEFYFEHITQWAIREHGETFFVLNWMFENDDNFNQWANSLSYSEWEDFRESIYETVDEKMKEISIQGFDEQTINEMVKDISNRYWKSVTDGSSAISELCDEDEEFKTFINSLSEEEYDELVAKADEIVEQERDEIY